MHVKYLPMRWKTGDNYCYVLSDDATKKSWLIDPAYPSDILPYLKTENKTEVEAIVNTHHHYDHSGGNADLLKLYKNIPVIAGKDSPNVTHTPKHGEVLKLGDNVQITAIHTPCHTQDSICYFAQDTKTGEKAVFTGDTLFISGCGRFFEGNGAEMQAALQRLMDLPDSTKVYPGHEYTLSNVKFSKTVLGPNNKALKELEDYCLKHEVVTGAFTVADEKLFNPFVRLTDPEVIKSTKESDPVSVMDKLRQMKNNF
ncbi:hypothetical protein OGAPHI_002897 [Ogataea philodendri]|uniref:hydroxyacylglutathione hydrolase n=1 Tax=Ogataea philodendri TaxID=1378263 RepID=A0A9P8T5Q4_9ASCO|nr:uncharacterized protein OGAPHI_002897 [Ogataea philodendri]KAH3667248.1 hypothetical protein OGAPHI_002897 [Ogataea philodendri]